MKIDVLYFDGCPSWQAGLARLREALAGEGMQAQIDLVLVRDDADAQRLQFLGSPSFRVNGAELWPEVREEYALGCRVYHTPQGLRATRPSRCCAKSCGRPPARRRRKPLRHPAPPR